MGSDIAIEHHGHNIAFLTFVRSLPALHAYRVGSGFTLRLPAVIQTVSVPSGQPRLMISNLHGEVLVKDSAGTATQVGRLRCDEWVTGYSHSPPESSYRSEHEIGLVWSGTFADLALVERARDGRPPALSINLKGEYCFLLPGLSPDYSVRSEPQRLYCSRGQVEVSYPREVWVEMLRRLGVAENVLVEIPLPGKSVDPDWDVVWSALVDARNAFEQGGSTGWKGCVTSVRLALEKWQKLDPEDKGPGWVSPSRSDREMRTKKQRLDNIRWHLLQLAHMGAHTGADVWTRDDALLMLATLAALLAEHKP